MPYFTPRPQSLKQQLNVKMLNLACKFEISDFSNQFSFLLEVRKIRIPLYMHRVTHLLKSFKSTTNRFTLQFYGEFNEKYGQMPLLCSLWAVMFIYLHEIFLTKCR